VDIVLGVSMTPTTVRMVLVEGEKADGVTVDHDVFDIPADNPSATSPQQVVAAILGTRESAAEGGHRLVGTGVAWRDHAEAAALRDALAAHKIDDVMLVSELHAAGALAQAVGAAVGYERTALMFLERNTATLSVVDTADGSIVKVQSHDLHATDAVAELAAMVAGLETLESPPQGVFVVGSGVAIGAIKLQLESATSLPVSAPEEPEVALARGAALASAGAPRFEASTVGLAYSQDGMEATTAGAALAGAAAADVTQVAGIGYTGAPAALAYSQADPESQAFPAYLDDDRPEPAPQQQGRKPFLLVGSALTSVFVLGVTALVISLAVSIRPTVDQRPSPAESLIVPTQVPEALPPAPEAAVAPPPAPETIQAPVPVVQQAPQPQAPPRTVYVEAPQAPAPAPAAPAPAPAAPAPAPAAPPVVAPVVPPPVVLPPPVIQLPPPVIQLPNIFRPPWQPPRNNWPDWDPPRNQPDDDDSPRPTQTQTPRPTQTQTPRPTQTQTPRPTQTQTPRPTQTQQPERPDPPAVTVPQVPTVAPEAPSRPTVPPVPQVPSIQLPQLPQWPGSGGSGSGSGGSNSGRGSGDSGGGSGESGRGSGSGSGESGGGSGGGSGGDGILPLWPFE
jgi:hypothetical protein